MYYICNILFFFFAKFSSNSSNSLKSLTPIWYDKTKYVEIASHGLYVRMYFVFL